MSDLGKTYFQFPLCALAFGANEKDRITRIISFCCLDAGFVMFHRLSPEIRQRNAHEFAAALDRPIGYSKTRSDHVAAMLGAREIRVRFSNLSGLLSEWQQLSTFKSTFETTYGRDVEVRIVNPLVFEVRDNAGMSYREFAVLCAIYSCIGAKKYPVRITRQTIRCRMLGYRSTSIMQAEIANRTDGATPLTPRQINYTLDALHERQFFARARANERQTFYSHRMSHDELETRLITGKGYSAAFHQRRRQHNTEFMARLKQSRRLLK
jgi:hypothetical protein